MPNTTHLVIPYSAAGDQPKAEVYAAVAQQWDLVLGRPWIDWSGVLQVNQGVTTNIAKAVNYARYRTWGKHLEFSFKVTMSASGTAGSIPVFVGLPISAQYSALANTRGACEWVGSGVGSGGRNVGALMGNTHATQLYPEPQGEAPGATGGSITAQILSGHIFRAWGRAEAV